MEAALRDRFGRLTADVDDIPEDDDCVAGHTAAPREITVRGRRAGECMTPSPAWTLTDWPRYGPTANRHRTGRPSATPSPVPELAGCGLRLQTVVPIAASLCWQDRVRAHRQYRKPRPT